MISNVHHVYFESAVSTVSFCCCKLFGVRGRGHSWGLRRSGCIASLAGEVCLFNPHSSHLHFSALEDFRSIHDISAKVRDLMLMYLLPS